MKGIYTDPLRILIVEDDQILRESLSDYLEDRNHTVFQAANGREGLSLFRQHPPDLVFSDLRMPEMNGIDLLHAISEADAELPLVVISGTGDIAEAVGSMKAGAWDFILKPIEDMAIIDHVISQVMERLALRERNSLYHSRLIQSEKMASLGVLTAGVAHELNNPLNFISVSAQALREYLDSDHPGKDMDLKMLVEAIETGVKRAADIISSLNQFSREKDDYSQACDIHAVLDNCQLMLQGQLRHMVAISADFCENPVLVQGNEGKLHQVFLNLLTNALHAIPETGRIDIKTRVMDRRVKVEIRDDGSGIPEDHLDYILDPFFTTKPPGEGTGLGLSITYNEIKRHGGDIRFESKENEGTLVIVELPLSTVSI